MSDYEVLEIGALDTWRTNDPVPEGTRPGKRFVDHEMSTQFIGLSANAIEPGETAPFWHTHSVLEEIYVFLGGRGRMALDDEVIDVGPGTTVRVGQGVWRHVQALPDSGEQLRWFCIRAGGDELGAIGRDGEIDRERSAPWG